MKTTTFLILLATSLIVQSQIAADGGEYGAGSPRLSLGEVTRAVLENNPAIKEAEHRWRAAIQRVRQANAWDDPRVAGESRMHRFVDVPPNAFMDQTLSIEQLIPITGKNLVRGRIAAAEAFSAFEEARRAQLDVIAKARATYFQLANAYDQLEINSKNLTSLKQIADISRSRYEAGLESAANVLIAETDYSKLLEARQDLERNLSDAQSQPLAKGDSSQQLKATGFVTVLSFSSCENGTAQFRLEATAPSANSPSRLALLCTFLI